MILLLQIDCKMKITTNRYDILESGSVIVPSNEYLEFELVGLRIRFEFIEEPANADGTTNSSITGAIVNEGDQQYLSVRITNYNSLFDTPTQMLEVGNVEGKKLTVCFSIVGLSSQNNTNRLRVFHYTWYKEK